MATIKGFHECEHCGGISEVQLKLSRTYGNKASAVNPNKFTASIPALGEPLTMTSVYIPLAQALTWGFFSLFATVPVWTTLGKAGLIVDFKAPLVVSGLIVLGVWVKLQKSTIKGGIAEIETKPTRKKSELTVTIFNEGKTKIIQRPTFEGVTPEQFKRFAAKAMLNQIAESDLTPESKCLSGPVARTILKQSTELGWLRYKHPDNNRLGRTVTLGGRRFFERIHSGEFSIDQWIE